MPKSPLPIAGLLWLLTGGFALAASASGMIKSIDPKTHKIVLENDQAFILAEGTPAEALRVGQQVTVTFDVKGGRLVATKVVVAK